MTKVKCDLLLRVQDKTGLYESRQIWAELRSKDKVWVNVEVFGCLFR